MRALLLVTVWCLCAVGCDRGAPAGPPGREAWREGKREQRLFSELPRLRDADRTTDMQDGAQVAAMLGRWRAFQKSARGTGYEAIARTRLERLEVLADDELAALRKEVEAAFRRNAWAGIDKQIEAFVGRFPGTPAAETARRWGAAVQEVRARIDRVPVLLAVNKSGGWKGGAPWLRTKACRHRGGALALVQPRGSAVEIDLSLEAVPKDAELTISMLVPWASGNQHGTIDVACNGNGLCVDWLVPTQDGGQRQARWRIGHLLREGRNTIAITLGVSALAQVWIYDVRVVSRRVPRFHEVIVE